MGGLRTNHLICSFRAAEDVFAYNCFCGVIRGCFRHDAVSKSELGMADQQTIEERLTQVEQELAEIKRRLAQGSEGQSWVERIAGTFKDDPEFDEIVKLGRDFRKSVP